jgi:hypothetical protein
MTLRHEVNVLRRQVLTDSLSDHGRDVLAEDVAVA